MAQVSRYLSVYSSHIIHSANAFGGNSIQSDIASKSQRLRFDAFDFKLIDFVITIAF